ncbi:phage portal protein [Pelagovum pacificum]|uniref:Phage portal protein n=1 Tax=Pelagovum pacificum TaxID=2588711 RepID=A0A5C5GDS1_9RHOB|nr:phage portal protein [Pelagovum pacificum]QQA43949.1 phage portal protein [Pelagovum pacificum]TNY32922.1 phage portal protein [Pelagovum pacificum]
MSTIDRIIGHLAPGMARRRMQNRLALETVTAHYEAARAGQTRGTAWRPNRSDADGAARGGRDRLRAIARDMLRNSPLATRAQAVIANNVIGDGIIPKVASDDEAARLELQQLVEQHLDTVAIDADGRQNLYGLQRLAMQTIVESGEVLIRRRRRLRRDGLPLPFQVQVLEPDFLDVTRDGTTDDGHVIRDGIEYDRVGRRVAYHLYSEHPGALGWRSLRQESRRVEASEVLHIYRQDRPGQMRGVSWFAPVALSMQDLIDHQDAQLMRQKIAACFAAFRTNIEDDESDWKDPGGLSTLSPGRIQQLAPGEDIKFASPPGVEGYDEFTRAVLRMVASGLGITYEALSGDLSKVNFSSARMGRLEMDRNVSSWQWLLMIPQMMQPIGAWTLEAWGLVRPRPAGAPVALGWVPPRRTIVDPDRELRAMRDGVRSGFWSRSHAIRELGYDPERVLEEHRTDAQAADAAQLVFDSDPRRVALSGVLQSGAPALPSDED